MFFSYITKTEFYNILVEGKLLKYSKRRLIAKSNVYYFLYYLLHLERNDSTEGARQRCDSLMQLRFILSKERLFCSVSIHDDRAWCVAPTHFCERMFMRSSHSNTSGDARPISADDTQAYLLLFLFPHSTVFIAAA